MPSTVRRRDLLVAGGGVLAAGCATAGSSPVMAAGAPLDLTSAEDRLRALVRLRGHETAPVWLWFDGVIYGRAPDDPLRPLFGFTAILAVRYRRLEDGSFAFEQRESNHYVNLTDGAVLGDWENPYTQRKTVAVGYVSPLLGYRMDLQGTYPLRNPTELHGAFAPQLADDGVEVWSTERRANEFPAGVTEDEFPDAYTGAIRKSADVATYRARLADVVNVDQPFVYASTTITADTPWLLWMLMGRRPGHVIWIGSGAKAPTLAAVPQDVTTRVEQAHPGFLADPWDFDRTPFSSAAQMRRLRAEGRM